MAVAFLGTSPALRKFGVTGPILRLPPPALLKPGRCPAKGGPPAGVCSVDTSASAGVIPLSGVVRNVSRHKAFP